MKSEIIEITSQEPKASEPCLRIFSSYGDRRVISLHADSGKATKGAVIVTECSSFKIGEITRIAHASM